MNIISQLPIAGAIAFTSLVTPTFAADISAPIDPWEFYVGVHGGAIFGDGNYEFGGTNFDLDGTRAIFGGLAGVNYRMDNVFLGLEGDVGLATGNFKFDFFGTNEDGCGNGAWCDANGHVRARVGFALDNLDLFVAGGLALADGSGGSSVIGGTNNDMFVGWSLGAGADYTVTDQFKLRIEFLHDDYGNRHPVDFDPNYSSNWTDNTVRAAAIFQF